MHSVYIKVLKPVQLIWILIRDLQVHVDLVENPLNIKRYHLGLERTMLVKSIVFW